MCVLQMCNVIIRERKAFYGNWEDVRDEYLKKALDIKYDPKLNRYPIGELMTTDCAYLCYQSVDRWLGNGTHYGTKVANDPGNWQGANVLGLALMEIRERNILGAAERLNKMRRCEEMKMVPILRRIPDLKAPKKETKPIRPDAAEWFKTQEESKQFLQKLVDMDFPTIGNEEPIGS